MENRTQGYRRRDAVCPYCECSVMAIEDDGEEKLLVRCWCGATARAERDDLSLVALPEVLGE